MTMTQRDTLCRIMLLAAGLAASPAMAAETAAPRAIPAHPENMTTDQLQGVSCIISGVAAATGAVLYSSTIAAAAATVSDWTIPLLAIPVAAGGYAVGCNVGSITGPGFYWLYQRFFASP